MLKITPNLAINVTDIQFSFIRSPGPGGQNVNKVATGVLLRYNITAASLPEEVRARLRLLLGSRITQEGDLIIKATRFRTQERNKTDALMRLQEIIRRAAIRPKKRKKTKPTFASVQRRLEKKKLHAKTKSLRSKKSGGGFDN